MSSTVTVFIYTFLGPMEYPLLSLILESKLFLGLSFGLLSVDFVKEIGLLLVIVPEVELLEAL